MLTERLFLNLHLLARRQYFEASNAEGRGWDQTKHHAHELKQGAATSEGTTNQMDKHRVENEGQSGRQLGERRRGRYVEEAEEREEEGAVRERLARSDARVVQDYAERQKDKERRDKMVSEIDEKSSPPFAGQAGPNDQAGG